MPDCAASDQFFTEMKKISMPGRSGTGPSQCSSAFFWSNAGLKLWMQYADASISFLDADAQLWCG
jgi:hypothetical protein